MKRINGIIVSLDSHVGNATQDRYPSSFIRSNISRFSCISLMHRVGRGDHRKIITLFIIL